MSRSKTLSLLYPASFLTFLSKLNVLVVGAGGIGCELLKVLSKFSFNDITIIDLDTIEVSNLNRQFLFRKEHKGLAKAEVAKNTLLSLNPTLKIHAYESNIKEFGVKFFKEFDVVFSALDNAEARSYLNSMCVTLNKPLLESGTTGFKGQAMLLKRGISRCYDCVPKGQNKTYQVCTIRTLPEKPLHCIIWAKFLFGVLFGNNDEANLLEDMRDKFEKIDEGLVEVVFNELFESQIQKQKDADPKKFEKLRPLNLKEMFSKITTKEDKIFEETAETKQKVFPLENYVQIFIWAFKKLMELKNLHGFLSFEKDDDICIKFVTAASNLRAHIFSIDLLNEFQTKEIAGNIIPAICSTNAIVAAIEVSEAMKFLFNIFNENIQNNNKECYVQNDLIKKINPINPTKPNPKCMICNESLIPCLIFINMETFSLEDFFKKIVCRNTETKLPDNCTLYLQNLIIFEQGDYLDEDEVESNKKKLVNCFSTICKGTQDTKLTLTIEEKQYLKFLIINDNTLKNDEFLIENDFLNKSELGNIKEFMVTNHLDYEEQVKRQEEEENKTLTKKFKENNGVCELEESEDDELIIEEKPKNNGLKRLRPEENLEEFGEKPLKHIKLD